MAVKIYSCINQGLHTEVVEVEAEIFRGMASFSIIGLGDTAIQESKQRIRSAIKNSNFEYPRQKKLINLAPANLKKYGPHFDLPIAVSLLIAGKSLPPNFADKTVIVGELALDGSVRPINGVLTMAINLESKGWKNIVIPEQNITEGQLVKKLRPDLDLNIYTIKHLRELHENSFLSNPITLNISQKKLAKKQTEQQLFQQIEGHAFAKRALTIAAAGGHHILFTGPPGVGKTLLAKTLRELLPPLTNKEAIEIMNIYSVAGKITPEKVTSERPFRQVHSSCSLISILGGGNKLQPGEISLAHHGVLFIDEIAEFSRTHIESLRQPLEDHRITISRSSGSVQFPAKFILVASMNPCPCGYYGDRQQKCTCRPYQIIQYQKKLSGPIMDRLDMVIHVEKQRMFTEKNKKEQTPIIQIERARKVQHARFKDNAILNSNMSINQIQQYCITPELTTFLNRAAQKYNLSNRGQHQILKLARTIADLDDRKNLEVTDVAEALQYRISKTQ